MVDRAGETVGVGIAWASDVATGPINRPVDRTVAQPEVSTMSTLKSTGPRRIGADFGFKSAPFLPRNALLDRYIEAQCMDDASITCSDRYCLFLRRRSPRSIDRDPRSRLLAVRIKVYAGRIQAACHSRRGCGTTQGYCSF